VRIIDLFHREHKGLEEARTVLPMSRSWFFLLTSYFWLVKLSSCDRGDDTDFVALFDGGVLIFEETNVFIVEEDVDEAADIALFVTDALGEARVGFLQACEDLGDCIAVGGNDFFFFSEFTEGCRDANGCGHWIIG
jgi:hypothetical protein